MLCGGFPKCRINVSDALSFLEKRSARVTERLPGGLNIATRFHATSCKLNERLYFFTHS
jgi:hypothetical protein